MSTAPRLGVLYTGGTIGMQPRAGTLAPSADLADSLHATLEAQHGEALRWQIATLAPPIDSADATPATWHAMADAILALADAGCDGVLVLHGTDTLAHSAAAMAFLLQGLPIRVVFTGSMLPAIDPDSDAWPNLRGAIAALREPGAAGVRLHFAGRTLSAVRCSKRRSEGFDAFAERAPGPVADRVPAPWPLRQRWQPRRVALLTLHPGFAPELLDALPQAGIAGCVLACYGSGTAPTGDAAFMAALARAHRAGVLLLAVSQCADGRVRMDSYEASRRLRDAGVIDGGGMGVEAALGKLHALLAAGLTGADCAHWLRQDLCGEM
ncbi:MULTISPECIES: asparaginase [unclassified Variovorax]|uniref:asparaginase n=1 Tax=unclassified Variovorax TaxID=663243 RepID=UPI0025773B1F|nr:MULTISPECIES: asparaginase [unclassified Variovorax]MDM0087233.1 asparaginase [Variovorax sp. J22G40]MDM0144510.1 asparaginase [Variovorax sp. J2P1-31]